MVKQAMKVPACLHRHRGYPGGVGVDARPYLSPDRATLDSWDGLTLFI